ncbi:MAG: FHA domain-containing protein [Gammaproteobacteria bacterium]|nr:FHA domain-containing protein [Gammaproteobacteria bacterium]
MVVLKQISNGVVISKIEVAEDDFTIGRNNGNSLQLADGVVSGVHAVVSLKPNKYVAEWFDISIRDLDSTNGTYVNDIAIKEQEIRHGDVIRIGTYEFKVFDDKSTSNTETLFYVPDL